METETADSGVRRATVDFGIRKCVKSGDIELLDLENMPRNVVTGFFATGYIEKQEDTWARFMGISIHSKQSQVGTVPIREGKIQPVANIHSMLECSLW